MIEKVAKIKQYSIKKKYPLFNIKESDNLPSLLDKYSSSLSSNQNEQTVPVSQMHKGDTKTVSKTDSKQEQPKQSQLKSNAMDEEDGVDPEDDQQKSEDDQEKAEDDQGPTHEKAIDLKVLTKAEQTEYLGLLMKIKPIIQDQNLDIKKVIDYDKSSMSCKFLSIYCRELERQQETFITQKDRDVESSNKCKTLFLEFFKKKSSIEKLLQSGKNSPQEYMTMVSNEYSELISIAKIIKKIKLPKVFNFIIAKMQIIDSEIKELEEFLKSA